MRRFCDVGTRGCDADAGVGDEAVAEDERADDDDDDDVGDDDEADADDEDDDVEDVEDVEDTEDDNVADAKAEGKCNARKKEEKMQSSVTV